MGAWQSLGGQDGVSGRRERGSWGREAPAGGGAARACSSGSGLPPAVFGFFFPLGKLGGRKRGTICKSQENLVNLSYCVLRISIQPGSASLGR